MSTGIQGIRLCKYKVSLHEYREELAETPVLHNGDRSR
jgi:hypothetical protein